MDWTSIPNLLHALFVALLCVMFAMGYRAGDRLI